MLNHPTAITADTDLIQKATERERESTCNEKKKQQGIAFVVLTAPHISDVLYSAYSIARRRVRSIRRNEETAESELKLKVGMWVCIEHQCIARRRAGAVHREWWVEDRARFWRTINELLNSDFRKGLGDRAA